ncbi:MAG: response regulator [Bacteroidota bacterium]
MPELLKVLLIDDNPDDRLLIIRELKKLFIIDVEEVINNQEFELSLKRLDFDIVITDYQLRWTTGIEVLIKTKTIRPLLPVIMFTGTGNEEIAVMAMKVGLDDYILKSPQHYVRLAMSVNSAINRMKEEMLRKHAESELRKSEENYRALVENIEIGFTRIDKDFNIIMVNSAQSKMFNRPAEDFIGMKCYDLYDKSQMLCPCSVNYPNKSPVESLSQGFRRDNSTFEVQLRTFPTLNDKGERTGYIEITEDISGKLRSERMQEVVYNLANAVLESESLEELVIGIRKELSRLIDTSGFSIILCDEFTGYINASINEKRIISGIDQNRMTLVRKVITEEKPFLFKKNEIDEMLKNQIIDEAEPEVKAWIGVPLKSHRKIIGALVLQNTENELAFSFSDLDIMQFVSNQIAIAVENKRGSDSLRNSEVKFRSVIEQSSDGVLIVDMDGLITEWNHSISNITQITRSNAIGRQIWDVQYDIMEYKDKDESFRSYLKQKFSSTISKFQNSEPVVIENTISIRDGESKVLQVSLFPISIDGQSHIGAFLRDITSQKKITEEINSARFKAEESDRLKTAFLSNISYEIRTPLNAIVGFAALLSENDISYKERKKYSDQIFENSSGLLNQFNNIIEISKIESGTITISRDEFEINEFIDRQMEYTRNSIDKSTIELRVMKSIPESRVMITSDQAKLQHVINQLIANAYKFTMHGIIELGYYLANRNNVVFYVSDTGPGIPAEKVDFVFDKFRQADEQIDRRYSGLGIGLSIVKKIVNLLDGEIQYEPLNPVGSLFRIVLPLIINKKDLEMETFSIDNIASTTDKWIDKTILIVEDVESNYQFLAATLRRSGASLVWARQGEDAIEMIEKGQNFNLVLMDVQLAGMDGYEVTRRIKELRPDMPIVAQTAYAMVGEKEKSFDAGCDDYLAKPIRPSLLIQTISKYLL